MEVRAAFEPLVFPRSRFTIAVAHRRAGKTVAAVQRLIISALSCPRPHARCAYIAPTYRQAKDIAWEYLKRFAGPLASDVNESELRVTLHNGARVRLYGAENADAMRGIYNDDAVLDEYADMAPSVWPLIVRPTLSDRGGKALFIGTPKGRNNFFELFDAAASVPDWSRLLLRADETGLLPPGELDAARRDMTPEAYAQEYLCSFEAAILGAYFGREIAEAERNGRIGEVPPDPALPVHTAWDLGIGDATAIWFFQTVGPDVHVIDHYEAHGHGLPHYAQVLAGKGYAYGTHYVPHDARARDLGTGRTRIETMQQLTGRWPHVLKAGEVMDGINAARLTLPRCRFDAVRCRDGLEALRQYRADFDEKARAFKDRPRHDWTSHSADAFRYLAMAWREMKPAPKPVEPVFPIKATPAGVITVRAGEMLKRHLAQRAREG
jgi:phage terminase large subunit